MVVLAINGRLYATTARQGISAGGSGSRTSSTHPMSAPNPINPDNIINSSNAGSMPISSTIGNSSSRRKRPCFLREQDQYMPVANVVRIMRRVFPPHAKISDDAKETVQECVSEYISFITGEANDKCQREQRKTITAEDVISAMGKLGFDDYVPCLTLFLTRYREQDRTTPRTVPTPTESYAYAAPPLPPMVANSNNTLYFDYGPGRNPQSTSIMTLPQGLPGPNMPNYGPGIGFQHDPNNPGMFESMGLSRFYGNTPGAEPVGGSSSQNAGSNFDPFAQFFK